MDEKESVNNIPYERSVTSFQEKKDLYGDITVVTKKTGARIAWSKNRDELRVNSTLFPDESHAYVEILRQVAQQIGLRQAFQIDVNALLELTHKYTVSSSTILRWRGLTKLRESNPTILRDQPLNPSNQTLTQEFNWALDRYVLTGKYPDQLSDTVSQVIRGIPQSKGRSLVDYISSGRYLQFDGENFTTYIQPLIGKLIDAERQISQSQQFEYRPSEIKDIMGSKELIEESDITVRVTPFYGGYYREQVCRYDPVSRQIVKESGTKRTWAVGDSPDDESVWQTKRTYEATYQAGKETLIKLPYGALPIVSTLKPTNAFQFMRDDLGIIYLDLRMQGKTEGVKKISFDFVLSETPSNQLNIPPTEHDLTPVGGRLDPETQTLLDDLTTQNWMSDVQKAREIVLYVRKLRYPTDETEIGHIDSLYLSSGNEIWTKIVETGVAHCYWANILRDELCKRLSIASRIPTGPYINSKDPRFDFTIVEAPGLDKHAWGEVWDQEKKMWTHRGMDATPPKTKDKSEDTQNDQSPSLDGDFGEPLIEQAELSQEEVKRLYQELIDSDASTVPNSSTPEQLAIQQFQEEKGVSWREWTELESWINGINKTPIPAETSIRHKPSTLYQEWRELFDLLYKRREILHQKYKGPVRKSEGEFLHDSVMAYIEMRFHEDDPLGYQRLHTTQRERIEVSVFEDDFILDISGSMSGQPADEQRKMVLSSEYNIKTLNDRLSHSRYRQHMTTPLSVRSRVAVFGDWTSVVQESTDAVSEKGLIELDKTLKAQDQSSQGLYATLQKYQEALDKETIKKIKSGNHTKVLTITSDGDVTNQSECIVLITQLRSAGIIVQGIGFGIAAQDIKVVCHDPANPDAAVVINDVREVTLVRHKLLMKHLSKL